MDGQNQPRKIEDAPARDYAQGRTVIADTAVAKVVALAARKVAGVHALGSGTSRSIGALRDAVGATDLTAGVRVEVGESQVAVDIVLIAEYGYPLLNVAMAVRGAVYEAVEDLVGRTVIEVNVEIADVFVPAMDLEKTSSRVRERLDVGTRQPVPTIDIEDQP